MGVAKIIQLTYIIKTNKSFVNSMNTFTTIPSVDALSDTAVQILDVAERLFAQSGIDNVSIREILRASGQSNLSAAHYHFGSREALIGMLLARRIRTINALRHQRLDALVASGRDTNVHTIVEVIVGVLAEVVKSTPWGPDYVRVVAQALFVHDQAVMDFLDPQTMSGHNRATAMLQNVLAYLPPRVFKDRIWILHNQTTYSIARWVQTKGPVTPANNRRYAALIRNTVDFMAAGMTAPLGKTVSDALTNKESGT